VPLANHSDVEARLGRKLTARERIKVDGLLPEASVEVRAYLGGAPDPSDQDAIEAVAVVTSRMVARAIHRGDNIAESNQIGMGPFNQTVNFGSGSGGGGVWLSASDRRKLKPYRRSFTALAISSVHA